ncbi:hypothetical protein Poli38472_008574 [Pythium oligandrum]|uniref:Ras-GAP domain-containing protein n=1 Tax=Pythium oligandrum TaxID=41045 RepID=A0A8K1C3N9_PYTOL|nr:hypothetical protein Poli38472_008574 [Pythium oligandrum]|eukprot:TMW55926.1 hypothetical protein Poli38472_008574 [Pythium oligandrum]
MQATNASTASMMPQSTASELPVRLLTTAEFDRLCLDTALEIEDSEADVVATLFDLLRLYGDLEFEDERERAFGTAMMQHVADTFVYLGSEWLSDVTTRVSVVGDDEDLRQRLSILRVEASEAFEMSVEERIRMAQNRLEDAIDHDLVVFLGDMSVWPSTHRMLRGEKATILRREIRYGIDTALRTTTTAWVSCVNASSAVVSVSETPIAPSPSAEMKPSDMLNAARGISLVDDFEDRNPCQVSILTEASGKDEEGGDGKTSGKEDLTFPDSSMVESVANATTAIVVYDEKTEVACVDRRGEIDVCANDALAAIAAVGDQFKAMVTLVIDATLTTHNVETISSQEISLRDALVASVVETFQVVVTKEFNEERTEVQSAQVAEPEPRPVVAVPAPATVSPPRTPNVTRHSRPSKSAPPVVRGARGHRINPPANTSSSMGRPKSLTKPPPAVRHTRASLARLQVNAHARTLMQIAHYANLSELPSPTVQQSKMSLRRFDSADAFPLYEQRTCTQNETASLRAFEDAVRKELAGLNGQEDLFLRSTSELSTLLRDVSQEHGRSYFRYALREVFGEHSTLYDGGVTHAQVIKYTQSVVKRLARAIHFAPLVLRVCTQLALREFQVMFPSCKHSERIVIGGVLFLRILCPALIKPEMFGFKPHTSKSLPIGVQIAKLLQLALRGTPTDGHQPEDVASNEFIASFHPYIETFFSRFPVLLESLPEEGRSQVLRYASWDETEATRLATAWHSSLDLTRLRGMSMSTHEDMKERKKKFSLRFWH